MTATAAQLAMVQRLDPILWLDQVAQSVLDDELTDCAAYLADVTLATTIRTRAVALLAIHNIRVNLPGVASGGGPVSSSSDGAGSRSYNDAHLPAGFRTDLYRTSHGQQLIGLFQSSSSIGFPMIS